MNNMKIVIFTGTILLIRHDARSIYVIETLKHLVKFNDLEITIVSPNDIPSEFKNIVKYVRYTLYDRHHFRKLSAVISSFFKLLTVECDLIHCYEREAVVIALLARKIKRKRIPIIFEIMGLAVGESEVKARYSFKERILRPYIIWEEKMLLRYSDGVFALTEAVREYIIKYYNVSGNKIFTIPHGVDLEFFSFRHEKDNILIRKLGLENKNVILYAGAISPLHGVLDLVKAMEIINKQRKDTVLIIVGTGPLELMIKKYTKNNGVDNIIFIGKAPHIEIPSYYSIADVLLNPLARCLQTELDVTTKIFEYLASGKPIVSSDLKSTEAVVRDNAVLVEPENPQSIAEGILMLLNDAQLRKKMGECGRKLILDYTWDKSAKRIYEGYKCIINIEENMYENNKNIQ